MEITIPVNAEGEKVVLEEYSNTALRLVLVTSTGHHNSVILHRRAIGGLVGALELLDMDMPFSVDRIGAFVVEVGDEGN